MLVSVTSKPNTPAKMARAADMQHLALSILLHP